MESLSEYLAKLEKELEPTVLGAVKGTIDFEAQRTADDIRVRTPVSNKPHLHLKETIVLKPVTKFGYYGWRIEHDGYNEYGVPYQLIANSLNKGRPNMPGLHHIDYAISKLKGMDERIAISVEKALNKI